MRHRTIVPGALFALLVLAPEASAQTAGGGASVQVGAGAQSQKGSTSAPASAPASASGQAAATAPSAAPGGTEQPVSADEAALINDLGAALSEQIVTGASRAAETSAETPATTSTVRADELRRYGIRTVAEALQFLALGVFTIGGQGFEYQTLGARGVGINGDSGNHFLWVVDGSVVNESRIGVARPGWALGLPLEMIDTIEVVLGGGSVLYGGSAMLGVINIKTKAARYLKGVRFITEYGVSPIQDANNNVQKWGDGIGTSPRLAAAVGHDFQFMGREAEVTAEFEWARNTLPDTFVNAQNQSPRVGTITQPPWGAAYAKGLVLEETIGGYSRVRLGRLSLDLHTNYHRTPLANAPSFELATNRVAGVLTRFDATYNVDITSRLSGFARFYSGRDTTDSVSIAEGFATTCSSQQGSAASRCGVATNQLALWQGLEVQGTYDFLGDGRLPLMIGIDGRARQVSMDSRRDVLASGQSLGSSGGMQSTGFTMSGYIQQRAKVASWLSLHAGVRYDYVKDSGKGYPTPPTANPVTLSDLGDVTNSAASPRFAILLFPTKTTTIHATAGTSFRAPTPQELFYASSAFFSLPKGLRPEKVRTAEVGIRQSFGVHRGLVSLFASEWQGLIGIGGTTTSGISFRNAGTIENYGVNAALEGNFALSKLQYGISFTYGYARRSAVITEANISAAARPIVEANKDLADEKTRLIASPEVYGNAHVSYAFGEDLPTLGVVASVLGNRSASLGYSDTLYMTTAPFGPPPTTNAGGYQWPSQYQRTVDPQVMLRGTLSGNLPKLPNWRYRLVGDYVFGSGNAVTWGPTPGGTYPALADIEGHPGFGGGRPPAAPYTQFYPISRLTIFAGLEVQLDP